MSERRIIVYGNSASGKTTLARRLAGEFGIPCLELDAIAWGEWAERKPLEESVALLQQFMRNHREWIIEGCYGDLIEAVLPACTELHFLNPGATVCVERARRRKWEATEGMSQEKATAAVEFLVKWIGEYETRQDEFGLARHRRIYESFCGTKRESTLAGME